MTDWLDGKLFPTQYPARFEVFWKAYPCKQGKPEALKAFNNAKIKVSFVELLASLERYKAFLAKNPNRQPLHASTYLNQERWTDEYAAPQSETTWRVSAAVEQTLRRRMQ